MKSTVIILNMNYIEKSLSIRLESITSFVLFSIFTIITLANLIKLKEC